MERKTITTKEFEERYGYKWLDLAPLKWLNSSSVYTYPMTSVANDCPALLFLKVVFDFRPDFEVYEDSAPVLAEIIRRSKEQKDFHCFAFGNDVYCVWKDETSANEELEHKRFRIK